MAAGRKSKTVEANSPRPGGTKAYAPPDKVGERFFWSNAFVRGLRGPFGSGKSVTCLHEILRRSQEQEPWPDAAGQPVRRTRWAVVRNTFPELKLTTVKTWLEWVPESLGPFLRSAPYTHHLMYPLPDGTFVDCEVIFLALDRPSDVSKLLSLDLTGVWINEAREIAKEVLDGLTARVNRFPSPDQGGPTWSGIIMDTNSPPEDHWWPIMAGDVQPPEWLPEEERKLLIKPPSWEFYSQPPAMLEIFGEDGRVMSYAMNPERANKALPDRYYLDMLQGKSRTWVEIYILNRYRSLIDGKPVYPEWSTDIHVAKQPIVPRTSHAILIGADFGRTPAAVFGQDIDGQVQIFHELIMAGVSTQTFAATLNREIVRRNWHDFTFQMWGDPAGDDMAQTRDETSIQIMRSAGLKFTPAPTNDQLIRIEAVSGMLTRTTTHGPAMLVSPTCKGVIAAHSGGYQFKLMAGFKNSLYDSKPWKNRHSHIADAVQYLILGSGHWKPVFHMKQPPRAVTVQRQGNPFSRQQARTGILVRRWNAGPG